jgi:hypothetical protein
MRTPVLFLLTLLAVTAVLLRGQSKTGTTVGQFLLIEPSSRITGMGNAGATVYGEIQSAYYNPASIGLLTASGGQFTHCLWLADITYDYAGASLHLGDLGNLYASLTSLNSGEIDVRTAAQPEGTGEQYTVSDIAFGVGYGIRVSDRFSIGVQLFYLQETIWHSAMSAFSMNVGTIYQISPDGFRIGASVSNFGTRAKYDGRDLRILYDQNPNVYGDNATLPAELFTNDFPLPILFRVGVGMPFTIDENNKVLLVADAFHPSDNQESVSVGAEWTVLDMFSLRGGYQNIFLKDSEMGLTLGAGVRYATEQFALQAHRVTFGITF